MTFGKGPLLLHKYRNKILPKRLKKNILVTFEVHDGNIEGLCSNNLFVIAQCT